MKLFLAHGDDANGENQDYFVVAEDVDQARSLWQDEVAGDANDDEAREEALEALKNIRIILDDVAGTRFDVVAQVVDWTSLVAVWEA